MTGGDPPQHVKAKAAEPNFLKDPSLRDMLGWCRLEVETTTGTRKKALQTVAQLIERLVAMKADRDSEETRLRRAFRAGWAAGSPLGTAPVEPPTAGEDALVAELLAERTA